MVRSTWKVAGNYGGFTLLELIVVICVISVLGVALLNRVQFYQRMAEKTAMEQTAQAIRSALGLRVVSLIAKNRIDKLPELAKQNPMNWLAQRPANYAGEYFGGKAKESVVAGQWYFDLKDRNLVYLVHNHSDFFVKSAVPVPIRFRTKLVYAAENFPGESGQVTGKPVEGVVLEQIDPYVWN
jgi:prepilin-type N-terminal cleavage/methylation domain-containing protein